MSFRIKFNDELLGSLSAIAQYIAVDSPQNAQEVAEAIVNLIDSLETMPGRFRCVGKSRRNGSPVHRATTHSFNIYYRIDSADQTVFILHIQRGTRKIPRRFE